MRYLLFLTTSSCWFWLHPLGHNFFSSFGHTSIRTTRMSWETALNFPYSLTCGGYYAVLVVHDDFFLLTFYVLHVSKNFMSAYLSNTERLRNQRIFSYSVYTGVVSVMKIMVLKVGPCIIRIINLGKGKI